MELRATECTLRYCQARRWSRAMVEVRRQMCGGATWPRSQKNVYTLGIYIGERFKMATAKVFKSGNSQAVRLPKAFRVKSKEVEISRRGDEIVLRERTGTMARAFDLLVALPEDLTLAGRKKDKPQKRKGL